MRLRHAIWTISAALLLGTGAAAQLMTLSQSVSSTATAANSGACGPNPLVYTVDNGYFRSYPLAALPAAIQLVSVTFGVQDVVAPPSGAFPLVIRIFKDPTPGTIAPYAGLTLVHTENFSLPTTTSPTVVTRALTGPPVVLQPTDTLVVELYSPDGAYTGSRFVIGSNNLGQTGPSFIRAPACAFAEPTDTTTINLANMHIVLDVNYVVALPPLYAGTGEDLLLFTGINANPLTAGIFNEVKTATAGNTVTMQVLSPGGTFNFREVVILFQVFQTGVPPFPPLATGIPFTAPGFLLGGAPPPVGPALLSPSGTTLSVAVPPGFAGSSVLLQGVIITWTAPTAANGLYATSDAHEIQLM